RGCRYQLAAFNLLLQKRDLQRSRQLLIVTATFRRPRKTARSPKMNEMEPHRISGTYIVPTPPTRSVLRACGTGFFSQCFQLRERTERLRRAMDHARFADEMRRSATGSRYGSRGSAHDFSLSGAIAVGYVYGPQSRWTCGVLHAE